MSPREWVVVIAAIISVVGVIYAARRAGKSSDRAQKVALETEQSRANQAANSAENSGYTRAQDMIAAATKVQQESFDRAIAQMQRQVDDLQARIERQDEKIASQHRQIQELQQGREKDRAAYVRYVRDLHALLDGGRIAYPPAPPFFD